MIFFWYSSCIRIYTNIEITFLVFFSVFFGKQKLSWTFFFPFKLYELRYCRWCLEYLPILPIKAVPGPKQIPA